MRIKELREQHNLVQRDVADYLNCSVPSYCRYETGERMPSIEILGMLADFYHVSVDYIVDRAPSEGNITLGHNIARLRKQHGYTQSAFAEMLHVTKSALRDWETGRSAPDGRKLEQIAQVLGMRAEELLSIENTPHTTEMEIAERIAAVLRQLREEKGVSRDEVAVSCQISRIALLRYEHGERLPRVDCIMRMAQYYGVTVDAILGNSQSEIEVNHTIRPNIDAPFLDLIDDLTPDELRHVATFIAGLKAARTP